MAAGSDKKAQVTPLRSGQKCPECGKPASRDFYPFCSQRCKALDLGRWLSGAYAIPASEADEDIDDGAGGQGDR